jgi:hypothetical protein
MDGRPRQERRQERRLEKAALAFTLAVGLQCRVAREILGMRGLLIGLAVVIVLVAGGFSVLVLMAEGLAPEQTEIRVEVTDALEG